MYFLFLFFALYLLGLMLVYVNKIQFAITFKFNSVWLKHEK